jgi:putative cell wall-binding protein
VGSVTDALQVSSFSNIGVQVRDRGVVAPGSSICSSIPTSVLSSGFGCLSGTSMASPHVAGLAALVKQAKPNVTVAEMKAAVRTTSAPYVSDTRNFTVQRYDPASQTYYADPVVGSITNLPLIDAWSAIGAATTDQGELRGRLYDVTTGQQVALPNVNATASLSSSNQVSGPAQITSTLTTDAQGDYRLRLAAGSWTAQVSYTNYLPTTTNADTVTTNGSTTLDVDIEVPRGSVDGVIDQSAGPFSSVAITLQPTGSTAHAATTISVDPLPGDGAFSLPDIRVGTWSLTAVSGDYVSDPIDVTVTSGAATAIVNPIAMIQQVGTLAGTVTDSLTGLGLSGQAILIGTPLGVVGTRTPLDARVTFGAGGTFSVAGVRSGEWAIDFEVPNYDTLQENVTIATGQTTNVSVALDPKPGVVQGSVSDPSATASVGTQNVVIDENINLTLAPDVPSPERSTMTLSQSLAASGGSFSITNVVPGDWTLNGTVFGYEPLPSTSVSVSPNGTADVGLLSLVRRTAVAVASPASGTAAGGTEVTIYGKHLTGTTGVSFGGVAADPSTITVIDDTEITVRTPAVAAATVNVVVTTPIGSSTETVAFTFTAVSAPAPTPAPAPAPVVGGGGGGGGPSPATSVIAPSPTGSAKVDVGLSFGTVKLALSGVSGSGDVTVTPKAGKPSSDSLGVIIPGYWLEISTTISDFGTAEVCAPIETTNLSAYNLTIDDLRLFHWDNGVRTDITTSIDTKNLRVCGVASSFSPFAVGALQTRRVAGLDRYETASAVSSEEFSPGVNMAFVVTGEKFPDALAAGAAAGRLGGPVLLTRFGSLPTSTRSELQRLRPKRVLVVGGPAVVSDAVLAEIRDVVGAVSVERVWGSDRFETSAELSAQTVAVAGGTVYVGSGLGFTEILAASAAAGRDDAPLLLVAGTGPLARVPTGVARELQRLRPTKIVIVGGSMLVSPAVVESVRALAPSANITQVGGADAYDTAAKIARTFSPGGTVYVATGEVFADGLAGGAVAAVKRSAMVMVPARGDLASYIGTALGLLRPQRIVVLGGSAAIDYGVENAVARYLPG